MALGDYNYDEYLDPNRFSDILPASSFDPSAYGSYNNNAALSKDIIDRVQKTAEVVDEVTQECDPTEVEDCLEDWWNKEQGGDPTSDVGQFKGVERTAENNFGYIDKPGIMTLAGLLPGIAGILGSAANIAINANNIGAINAARKDLGLEPMTTKEAVKTAVLGTNGKVGSVTVDGKKVDVTLESDKVGTDKKGNETVSYKTAKEGVEKVKEDVARTKEPIKETKTELAPAKPAPTGQSRTITPGAGLANLAPNGLREGAEPKFSMGPGRSVAPDKEIISILDNSVKAVLGPDWTIDITSGTYSPETRAKLDAKVAELQAKGISPSSPQGKRELQALGQVGTTRHTTAKAVDAAIINPTTGQSLTRNNTNEEIFRTIEQEAAARGAKGIGFGKGYMDADGRAKYHMDTVRDSTWGREAAKVAQAMDLGRSMGPLPAPDNRDVLPQPVDKETMLAAERAPTGRGFLDSPELASNKENPLAPEAVVANNTQAATSDAVGFMAPVTEKIEETQPQAQPTQPTTQSQPTEVPPAPEVQGMTTPTESPTKELPDFGNMTPAEYAARGYVERTPADKGLIAFTLAGELDPRTLADLNSSDPQTRQEAEIELANMITTVENRAASGKFGDGTIKATLQPSQYNSLMKNNLNTTVKNFNANAEKLVGLVDSYYSSDGIVPTNYGLTHYHNDQVNSDWSSKMKDKEAVGRHTFGILDSQYDVPVTDTFKAQKAETEVQERGSQVPTPTSSYSTSVTDAGKGFLGTPEQQGQVFNEPAPAAGTFQQTPDISTIDTKTPTGISVDSGKGFGLMTGGEFAATDQAMAGVTAENTESKLMSPEASITGENSFMGESKGQIGESPGVFGDMGGKSETSIGFGGSGGEGSSQGVVTGTFSVETSDGNKSSGDVIGVTGQTGLTDAPSSSNTNSNTDSGGFMDSLSDAFSDAFGGNDSDDSESQSGF